MKTEAENKGYREAFRAAHSAETVLSELKTAVARRDWKLAGFRADTLRFGHGWTYARFAAELGSETWEQIAAELDDAESEADE